MQWCLTSFDQFICPSPWKRAVLDVILRKHNSALNNFVLSSFPKTTQFLCLPIKCLLFSLLLLIFLR